ncbi:MAG: 30S ribosomal protein S6, partial [Candidatus Thiodiazotropha sp.]
IECNAEALSELESAFRFNDAVIRNLIIRRDEAITDVSQLAKSQEEEERERSSVRGRDDDIDEGDGQVEGDSELAEEAESSSED